METTPCKPPMRARSLGMHLGCVGSRRRATMMARLPRLGPCRDHRATVNEANPKIRGPDPPRTSAR
eukprot:3899088-Pyramimonas_sp.AAC.1